MPTYHPTIGDITITGLARIKTEYVPVASFTPDVVAAEDDWIYTGTRGGGAGCSCCTTLVVAKDDPRARDHGYWYTVPGAAGHSFTTVTDSVPPG